MKSRPLIMFTLRASCIALLACAMSLFTRADIFFGTSNAQQGASGQLGQALNLGAEIYFDVINQQGGIHNHKIQIVKMDDGYEPVHTVHNTKTLLERDCVGLLNYVGTPNTKAVLPLVAKANQLLITPFTGADFLRTPSQANVFNLRASYKDEADKQIAMLLTMMPQASFALVIQADEFGLALEKHYQDALQAHGLSPATTIRYRRNTTDLTKAAAKLAQSNLDVVLFVGPYAPLFELIKLANQSNYSPVYSSVSFVSSQTLFERLGHEGMRENRVLVTEVVPSPASCQGDVCEQFREHAKRYQLDNPNQVHFEGYLNAAFITEALRACPSPPSQACLSDKLMSFRQNTGQGTPPIIAHILKMMGQVYVSTLNLPISNAETE